MRAATVAQAVGKLCVRCRQVMLPGQAVQLDHADNGDPNAYVGYSHARCNASAGAARGNRMRAAAYRAMRSGGTYTPPSSTAVVVREPPPDSPTCHRTREEVKASVDPLPCVCGRTVSRCW